jgi:hypothetical protein
LYGSYVREVIVKISGLSYKLLLFRFRISSRSRQIYEKIARREVKRMATKRRNRVAFNSLTITYLFLRRNCLCHTATSKKLRYGFSY